MCATRRRGARPAACGPFPVPQSCLWALLPLAATARFARSAAGTSWFVYRRFLARSWMQMVVRAMAKMIQGVAMARVLHAIGVVSCWWCGCGV